MADITSTFNTCLKTHNPNTTPVTHHSYNIQRIDSFLQEAYSINARIADLTRTLRSTRPAYLSTAPPARQRRQNNAPNNAIHDSAARPLTHGEREAFDAQSKTLLRNLNAAIKSLSQAEEVRNQTLDSVALSKRAKSGMGALGRWAAGGAVTAKSPAEEAEEAKRNSLAAFRAAVIMFLEQRLGEAGKVQAEMMEVRIGREVEKSKSALYKSRGGANIPYAHDEGGDDDGLRERSSSSKPTKKPFQQDGDDGPDSNLDTTELTRDQLQMFESENADLLQYYEGQMEQISQAERSILEISELHSTLHANLAQQSEHIEQLVQESYDTTENLGKGNQELKRASERKSTAQAVFWGTVGFCGFLVVWDLVF
jgi:syntaxin 18